MTNEFKVGDKVVCVDSKGYSYVYTGEVYTVDRVRGQSIIVCNNNYPYASHRFVRYNPHEHREVIIAWANGAKVQYFLKSAQTWYDIENPEFHPEVMYRVKPNEPKKTKEQLEIEDIEKQMRTLADRLEVLKK